MLSEAKHLWIFRLPNWKEWPEILFSAQDDNCVTSRWPFWIWSVRRFELIAAYVSIF
jgi:hypothetical protein